MLIYYLYKCWKMADGMTAVGCEAGAGLVSCTVRRGTL